MKEKNKNILMIILGIIIICVGFGVISNEQEVAGSILSVIGCALIAMVYFMSYKKKKEE